MWESRRVGAKSRRRRKGRRYFRRLIPPSNRLNGKKAPLYIIGLTFFPLPLSLRAVLYVSEEEEKGSRMGEIFLGDWGSETGRRRRRRRTRRRRAQIERRREERRRAEKTAAARWTRRRTQKSPPPPHFLDQTEMAKI